MAFIFLSFVMWGFWQNEIWIPRFQLNELIESKKSVYFLQHNANPQCFIWCVHLFDACFERFGINLHFWLFLEILNTFDEYAAARSATALTLVHGLVQSAEVAMRFFLFVSKKYEFITVFRQLHRKVWQFIISAANSTRTDGYGLLQIGTKTLLESLRIRIFFLVLSLCFKIFI